MEAVLNGFGWNVISIDGNDLDQILDAFDQNRELRTSGKPTAILANTTKGAGISFTAGTFKWHNGIATAEQLEAAQEELLGQKGTQK